MNVLTKTEKKAAKSLALELSDETLEAAQAINNTLTVAEIVRPVFLAHYTNVKLDVIGIMALIQDILRDKQAVFPRGIESTELRKIAVAASMFTADILAEVERRFTAGSTRYPLQSVKNCLSTYGKGEIGKIKLSNAEDQPRDCAKPRCKWYLIDKKD